MIAAALLLAAVVETPFGGGRMFADPEACLSHLAGLADAARMGGHEAVAGPYEIAAGDTRIHMVTAEGSGHRITEHRCLAATSGERSWHRAMAGEDEPFTVESVARKAEWLKQSGRQ